MPRKAASPCSHFGCSRLAVERGRCAEHQRAPQPESERERGSAAQRGYGHAWRQLRAKFLKRNPACEVCGEPATDVDHIVPRSQGGTDDESNLRSLCHRHHSQKTAREDGGFGRRGG